MRRRVPVAATSIGLACLFVLGIAARADEVTVLSAVPMQQVLEDIEPQFERATGHTLVLTFATLGEVVKRIEGGESADVVVIPRQGIDSLVKDGKAAAGQVTVIARSGIAVAVRKGARKPDISSPEALKRALLAAKSVAYSDPAAGGASGNHFTSVIERLGIVNEMKPKTILAKPGGDTGVLVANGRAELGVHQFQVLVSVPGIEIVGPLPGDLQDTIVFATAIMRGARSPVASKALVDFLRTPESAAVIKAKGMEPAGR
jgi:molybdate transport system substrate-binding protein